MRLWVALDAKLECQRVRLQVLVDLWRFDERRNDRVFELVRSSSVEIVGGEIFHADSLRGGGTCQHIHTDGRPENTTRKTILTNCETTSLMACRMIAWNGAPNCSQKFQHPRAVNAAVNTVAVKKWLPGVSLHKADNLPKRRSFVGNWAGNLHFRSFE